jgi:hypothetical protein
MSDFKNDPGFGQLFRNKYKNKASQPDHKGAFTDPNGNEWEVSAWIKEGQNGKFFSLSIQTPYVNDKTPTDVPEIDLDDDIPF